MKKVALFILAFTLLSSCEAKNIKSSDNKSTMKLDTAKFNSIYSKYKEPTLQHRRFKHSDVEALILSNKNSLQVDEIGRSFQGRAIYELSYGKGDIPVMLWSQMHGDEATATMALFDLFNFLEGKDDGYDDIRELLSKRLNIHFIPMLNPDGAERYMRRTAQGIDMNRDARVGQTVEGDLLRKQAALIKPKYGFNLHDQNIYYNVPGTKNPVAISLLAPAFNPERDINNVREGAMQIAVGMNAVLQQYIPQAVAKYDDTYTPRGFGDNFQSWGASTVLIESGGMKGDPEKQQIRKLNFIIILNALVEIAEGSYKNYAKNDYEAIPFNDSQLHDVVLRDVLIERDGIAFKTDIAIRRSEVTVGRDFFVKGYVEDLGDLHDFSGYDELDAEGLKFVEAKSADVALPTISSLSSERALELLKDGIMAISFKNDVVAEAPILHNLPILLYNKKEFLPTRFIDLGASANFYLADKNNVLKYAVLNGYLIDLTKEINPILIKNRVL